jgi:hypothetical protein
MVSVAGKRLRPCSPYCGQRDCAVLHVVASLFFVFCQLAFALHNPSPHCSIYLMLLPLWGDSCLLCFLLAFCSDTPLVPLLGAWGRPSALAIGCGELAVEERNEGLRA